MKLEFDDLHLVEAKMLLDVLTAFRAGQPFHWYPPGGQANATDNGNSNPHRNRVSAVSGADKAATGTHD